MSKQVIIGPDLDERLLDGYYFVEMSCSNCEHPAAQYSHYVDVMVPKGIEKPTKLKCPNCRCETLS